MAQTPSDSGSASNTAAAHTLARGKACLRCRKRKMRCDGGKPACAQCARAQKGDACAYDDGRGKTRTQALREKIARLEEEIAKLRDPASAAALHAQSIFLHDPHAQSGGELNSRPATATSQTFDFESLSELGLGSERDYSGGVQRSNRPASGVFSYSLSPPIPQGRGHGRSPSGSTGGSDSPGSSPQGSPSPSTVGSISLSVGGPTASPYGSFIESFNSPPDSFTVPRTLSPAILGSSQLDANEVPREICQALFDIFITRRHQAGFALHAERVCASFGFSAQSALSSNVFPGNIQGGSPGQSSPMLASAAPQRHVVLQYAMLLWASLLMRGSPLDAYERTFLSLTQSSLADALSMSQHAPMQTEASGNSVSPAIAAIDALQASVILSRYFFACARLTEASYHASAAADLAVQWGLHQLNGADVNAFGLGTFDAENASTSALHLAPPTDTIELGERICVFWQVFVLDRLLSVALRRPPCIVDDDCVETKVDSPWPEDAEEYGNMTIDSIVGQSTLRTFFQNQAQPAGFSLLALRVKAAALYSAAARAAVNWSTRSASPAGSSSSPQAHSDVAAMFAGLEFALSRFASTLIPAHQLSAALPDEDRRTHVVVRTLLHAAMVLMHLRFARAGQPTSLDKCLRSARAAAMLARQLTDADYEYLDPAFGACWSTIASVFSLDQVQASAPSWLSLDLSTVLSAITRLGAHFPIMGICEPLPNLDPRHFGFNIKGGDQFLQSDTRFVHVKLENEAATLRCFGVWLNC